MTSTKPAKAAQISPDRFWVGIATIILVLIVMLASMVFSFAAVTEAAAWTHNPPEILFLAAVYVDGAIIAFTVSYAVRQWRRSARAKRAFYVLIGFTALSTVVNVTHAASGWDWDFSRPEAWMGMVIAGAAPIAALLTAEEITELAFTENETLLTRTTVAVVDALTKSDRNEPEVEDESEPEDASDADTDQQPAPERDEPTERVEQPQLAILPQQTPDGRERGADGRPIGNRLLLPPSYGRDRLSA